MCGFFGEISDIKTEKNLFIDLLNLSIKRGPDQQGYWSDEKCQFGFNRLSIIDTSENALQPLISPSGIYVLVFNGEIYNYKELQIKYNIQESELRSNSDSEIISHLLDKISIEELCSNINGMFSIAIYNTQSFELFLIRDFAGIKPFFYGIKKNGIVFSSQFDQIVQHPIFKDSLKLRADIFKEFIGLGYMSAPNTVFEDISQVEPGEIIKYSFTQNKIIYKKKYFVWHEKSNFNETNENTINQFENVFTETIKSQLNSDVPIATFLSGGIDSPLVTVFSKLNKEKIKAFTFKDNTNEMDESEIAKLIADKIEIEQIIEDLNPNDTLNLIHEHTSNLSEPLGDYSSIPTYIITKKAKKYATVMLSGDGGDELFWGYPRFLKSMEHFYWYKIPLFIRKIIVPIIRKINPKLSYTLENINNIGDWILYKQIYFKNLDDLVPNVNFSHNIYDLYKSHSMNKREFINYLKKNEFYGHLQRVLRKVDLMSMANSIEVRVPFLDKNIIEFSNQVKTEYGFTHKTPKYILRKLLEKYIDKSISTLPKKGFSIPLEKYLKNELKTDVLYYLKEIPFYGIEFMDKNIYSNIIDDYEKKTEFNTQQIWNLYIWQKWVYNNKLNY